MQGIVANFDIPKDPKNELFNKMDSFSGLQPGWASEESLAPTPIAIAQARQFIDLLPAGTQLPHVSVAEDGEINFFWHSDSSYIDVGIYGDNKIHYYVESEAAGIDKDGIEPSSTSSLPKDIISAIASFWMKKEPYSGRSGESSKENLPQSGSFIGVVANEGVLGRFICWNDWIHNVGKLTPAAIQIKDLISSERRRISVCHSDKMINGDIRSQIDKIRSKPDNSFSGIARAKTKNIRNLRTEQGSRSLCVIDDATPEFLAHALLRLDKGEEFTKSAVRRIRKPLLQILELHRSHIQKESQN